MHIVSFVIDMRDSVLLFLRTHLRFDAETAEERKLLKKRAKLAARVCDSLGALEEEHDGGGGGAPETDGGAEPDAW